MKPYIKYWRSALQKSQPYKPRKISTPDECIQQKIRMAESLLKSAFERESKLFLAEFQKPDYMPTTESNLLSLCLTEASLSPNSSRKWIGKCWRY